MGAHTILTVVDAGNHLRRRGIAGETGRRNSRLLRRELAMRLLLIENVSQLAAQLTDGGSRDESRILALQVGLARKIPCAVHSHTASTYTQTTAAIPRLETLFLLDPGPFSTMRPAKDLPCSDEFSSTDDYVESLLQFAAHSNLFQFLCGGVPILDFFTTEPGLFVSAVPPEWQQFLLECDTMALLDFLMRDDLDSLPPAGAPEAPPDSLLQYVKDIRRLS